MQKDWRDPPVQPILQASDSFYDIISLYSKDKNNFISN